MMVKHINSLCVAFLMVMFFIASTAFADDVKLSKEEKAKIQTLEKIEDYIKSIDTLQARFTQTAEVYADDLMGTFYLERPGKLRFEYDDPIKDYIVSDGRFIYYWDGEMENYSSALTSSTLAAFLVREEPGLTSDKFDIIDIARKNKMLGITVIYKGEPEKGRLTLIFKEKPTLELARWQVVDAQGYVTQIELSDIKKGTEKQPLDFDQDLFVFVDPDIANPGFN